MIRFHIWRPVTCLFFYPLSPQTGFHFLINLYFLYNYRCGIVVWINPCYLSVLD